MFHAPIGPSEKGLAMQDKMNNGINHILSTRTSYPVQLGVIFVAPNTHKKLSVQKHKSFR